MNYSIDWDGPGERDRDVCACVSEDGYSCFAKRYGIDSYDYEAIENDGGPCQCGCHEYGEGWENAMFDEILDRPSGG